MRYKFLRFPNGKAKAMTFSYDDGCEEDIRMADTLTKYGLKGTFNFNSYEARGEASLDREVVIEHILSKGHEIAVHGYLHRANGSLRPIEGIRDVLDCRLELENKYNRIIRGMAYPDTGIKSFQNDTTYEKVKNYLQELDIVYARTLGGDNSSFNLPEDWHRWMPTAHHNNSKIFEFLDEFINLDLSTKRYYADRGPRLFYIWGHSFEFTTRNNWELLDDICKKVSGNPEIWFATNIEIFNYVKAYESLIYSADGKKIYNPTLYTIWFDIDGVEYKIMSGETLITE